MGLPRGATNFFLIPDSLDIYRTVWSDIHLYEYLIDLFRTLVSNTEKDGSKF